LAHDIELIEPIGPIDPVLFVGNVNALPSTVRKIGSLENGSQGGRPIEFRMAGTIRMFTVDCK
jgi:hypothetical protein